MKILSGELEPTTGEISLGPGERLSVLEQDHFKYDDEIVLDTVIAGNQKLYDIMKEKKMPSMPKKTSPKKMVCVQVNSRPSLPP